jgi:hypothetical protein
MKDGRDGQTKPHMAVVPRVKWEARMMKLLMGDLVGAREFNCFLGEMTYIAQRGDGLFVAVRGDKVGKPYGQILGLTVTVNVGRSPSPPPNQTAYVAYPASPGDNRPRVVWNEVEGKPYDAISELSFAEGQPLYLAAEQGKTFVVHGTGEESRRYDNIGFLKFVRGRPFYVAQNGKEMFLVWGDYQSEPYDDISIPHADDMEAGAFATKGRQIKRLAINVA